MSLKPTIKKNCLIGNSGTLEVGDPSLVGNRWSDLSDENFMDRQSCFWQSKHLFEKITLKITYEARSFNAIFTIFQKKCLLGSCFLSKTISCWDYCVSIPS